MTITLQTPIGDLKLTTRTRNGLLNLTRVWDSDLREWVEGPETVGDLLNWIRTTTRGQFLARMINFGKKSHGEMMSALEAAGFSPEHKWTPQEAYANRVWRDCSPAFTLERFEVKAQVTEDQDGNPQYRLMARRADLNETFREYRPAWGKA